MKASRSLIATFGVSMAALCGAALVAVSSPSVAFGAVGSSSVSANWAGYVASGTDAATLSPRVFSKVSGTWVEPKADCAAATVTGSTSSAFWVGLGGNATNSTALEQTGTEVDCTASGSARYFAWYELVPAGSVQLDLTIKPGDRISASVGVQGTSVSIVIGDLTRHTSFSKTLHMSAPDTTSAEWIAEAPSVCSSSDACQQQPLTDFGTATFSAASAVSDDKTGSISSSLWTANPVTLESSNGSFFGGYGRHFGAQLGASEAVPGALSDGGSAFSVSWKNLSGDAPSGGYGYGGYGGGYGGYPGPGGDFSY